MVYLILHEMHRSIEDFFFSFFSMRRGGSYEGLEVLVSGVPDPHGRASHGVR